MIQSFTCSRIPQKCFRQRIETELKGVFYPVLVLWCVLIKAAGNNAGYNRAFILLILIHFKVNHCLSAMYCTWLRWCVLCSFNTELNVGVVWQAFTALIAAFLVSVGIFTPRPWPTGNALGWWWMSFCAGLAWQPRLIPISTQMRFGCAPPLHSKPLFGMQISKC